MGSHCYLTLTGRTSYIYVIVPNSSPFQFHSAPQSKLNQDATPQARAALLNKFFNLQKTVCRPLLPYAVIPETGISLFILEAKEQHLLHECQPGLLAVPLLLLFFLNCIFIHLRNRFWFRDSHLKVTMSVGLTSSVLGWRRLCTSPSPLSIIMITLSERKMHKYQF